MASSTPGLFLLKAALLRPHSHALRLTLLGAQFTGPCTQRHRLISENCHTPKQARPAPHGSHSPVPRARPAGGRRPASCLWTCLSGHVTPMEPHEHGLLCLWPLTEATGMSAPGSPRSSIVSMVGTGRGAFVLCRVSLFPPLPECSSGLCVSVWHVFTPLGRQRNCWSCTDSA